MAWEYFTGYPGSKLSENKIWYALATVLASTLQPQPLLVTAITTDCTTLLTGTHFLLGYLWWQWLVSIPWNPCYSKAHRHRREHELRAHNRMPGALITISDQDVTSCLAVPELPNSPAMWPSSDQSLLNMDLQVVSRDAMEVRNTIHITHKSL